MTFRQHIINLICATISIAAMTVAVRVAAERIDNVGSVAAVDVGATAITVWVFVAVWLLWAVCAACSYGARYARGDMRRRPGHGGRAPSWTTAQWAELDQAEMDAWMAENPADRRHVKARHAALRGDWDVAA